MTKPFLGLAGFVHLLFLMSQFFSHSFVAVSFAVMILWTYFLYFPFKHNFSFFFLEYVYAFLTH